MEEETSSKAALERIMGVYRREEVQILRERGDDVHDEDRGSRGVGGSGKGDQGTD